MKAIGQEGQQFFSLRLYVSLDWNHKTVWLWKEWWVWERRTLIWVNLAAKGEKKKTMKKIPASERNSVNCAEAKWNGYSISFCLWPFDQWDSLFFLFFTRIDFLSFSISIIVWMKETFPALTSSSIQIWNVTFACSIRWKLEEQIALHCLLERWHWPFFSLFLRARSLSLCTHEVY